MSDGLAPGRSLVTRRAIVDIVRGAVLGSYGVTGVDAGPLERLLGRLGLREPGIRVRLDRGLEIDLHLTVAYGVPVAEVARQVDSAVRYGIRRALGRDVRRLAVHVGGLRYQPASVPPTREPLAAPALEATEVEVVPSVADVLEASTTRAGGASVEATTGALVAEEPSSPAEAPTPAPTGAAGGRRRRGHSTNGRSPG